MRAGREDYQRIADDCYCNFYIPSPVIARLIERQEQRTQEMEEEIEDTNPIRDSLFMWGMVFVIMLPLAAVGAFAHWLDTIGFTL